MAASFAPLRPHLLVRADTRPGVGAGHALRQLALVERWPRSGAVTVALDGATPELRARFEAVGATVLDGAAVPVDDLVDRLAPDTVVLDGYAFGPDVQATVHGSGPVLAVVDDHGHHGSYSADLVVDPNLGPVETYGRRTPGGALLVGPRYALLRREFTCVPASIQPAAGRVVVLVGGAEPIVADALADRLAIELADPAVDVVTPRRAGLEHEVAAVLRSATVVVSAAGTTAWELCHLGRPSVLFAVAANQEPVGRAVADTGAARYLGAMDPQDPAAIAAVADAVRDLLADSDERARNASRGPALVDGRGADRVTTELLSASVTLRGATTQDARLLWEWANDDEVRSASFSTEPIPWADHERWLGHRLRDPGCQNLLAVADGAAWGQVRFDDLGGGRHEVGVSVSAAARGRGLAAPLIRAGVQRLFADTGANSVVARIKPENRRSAAAFLAADFAPDPAGSPDAVLALSYDRGRDGRD